MQISAANMLVAAGQPQHGRGPQDKAAFASALAGSGVHHAKPAQFAPPDLTVEPAQSAPAAAPARAAAAVPAQGYGAAGMPGAQLDIRV